MGLPSLSWLLGYPTCFLGLGRLILRGANFMNQKYEIFGFHNLQKISNQKNTRATSFGNCNNTFSGDFGAMCVSRLLLTLPVTSADEGSEKLIGRSNSLLFWVDHSFLSRVLPLVGLSSVLLTVMVIVLVVTTLISRSSQVSMSKRLNLYSYRFPVLEGGRPSHACWL